MESLSRRERQSDCVCKNQFRVTMTNQAFLKKKPTGGQSCISGKSKSEQKSTTDSACKKNTWLCLSLSEILSTTHNTQLRWFSTLTCPMSLPHCAIFKARNVLYLESLSVFSQLPAIHWLIRAVTLHSNTDMLQFCSKLELKAVSSPFRVVLKYFF